jgi:hypothetical protein
MMNLWLLSGSIQPSDGQPAEIIITNVDYPAVPANIFRLFLPLVIR